MRRVIAFALAAASPVLVAAVALPGAALLSGCPARTEEGPAGPVVETESPKSSPVKYKVLEDKTENNQVEVHLLVADATKHDDVEALLKFLYRHLWTRNEGEPAALAAYVYNTEGAYKTPPRTPVAQMVRRLGDLGPTFENKVPLEFWQEIEEALKSEAERDDAAHALTLTAPYAQPTQDGKGLEWVESLSLGQAMNGFTDTATLLFQEVPDLASFTYVGTWKDKEVVRVSISKDDYKALGLVDLGERVGQHHGRAFLELAGGKGSDKSVEKGIQARVTKEYRALLNQLKAKATVDPSLK